MAPKTDETLRSVLWDVPAACVLLTRLPMPHLPAHAFAHSARAVWAYPVVGLGLGALITVVTLLTQTLAPALSAGLVLAALILLTGALHEDGLADTADGLWGGQTRARRLEIMKDSRIGAYGVLALIVMMGLRWQGLIHANTSAIVTAMVLSRAMMPTLMWALPHARDTGLSQSVGRPARAPAITALLIGATAALLLAGWGGLLAICVALAAATAIGMIAKSKIQGQTGDILGATQITSEVAILIVLSQTLT